MNDAVKHDVSDEMVELFGINFWPINAASKIDAEREHIRNAISAALAAQGQEPVASIVPEHCSGSAFVFVNGCLHVKKDGSGYIVVDEDDFVLEDDRDGEGGSVHWIARFPAGEMTELRDFLNGQQFAAAPQPPAEGGWRDIASAPKDGTDILGYGRAQFGHHIYAKDFHVVWWDVESANWLGRGQKTTHDLSHWMPLPPAPANGGEQNG